MELESSVSLSCLTGYTVVLPSVSVGNVGQLAVDVLLATLKPSLVSQVHHPSLIPCCGSDPLDLDSSVLTTAMQLYVQDTCKLAVFQIRSGLLPGLGSQFLNDLLGWCTDQGVSRVVCLASSHAHERSDAQLSGSPLRYLATPSLTEICPVPQTFTRLETKQQFPGLHKEEEPEAVFIPGGGLAKRFITGCEERGFQGLVLLKFCSEGDNTQDAIQVADYLDQYLSWRPSSETHYRVPPSWKHLFGPPAPQEMFW
jgi:proteasome assembly chaperone 2